MILQMTKMKRDAKRAPDIPLMVTGSEDEGKYRAAAGNGFARHVSSQSKHEQGFVAPYGTSEHLYVLVFMGIIPLFSVAPVTFLWIL